jgi:hypothetical protein
MGDLLRSTTVFIFCRYFCTPLAHLLPNFYKSFCTKKEGLIVAKQSLLAGL